MSDFFQYDFLFNALICTLLLSIMCGIISPFMVAKKYAFMGEAISHSTMLGISLSLYFLTEQHPWSFPVTVMITLSLVMILSFATYKNLIPSDSMIGIFLVTSLSLSVILQHFVTTNKSILLNTLFGNILLVGNMDLYFLFATFIFVVLLFLFFYKQFTYFIFDENSAFVFGIKTKYFHFGFYLVLALIIISTSKLAGTILINSFLLIPGVFSLRYFNKMKHVLIGSIIFSLMTSLIGLYFSNLFELPPGGTLSLTQVIFLFLSHIIYKFWSKNESKH